MQTSNYTYQILGMWVKNVDLIMHIDKGRTGYEILPVVGYQYD